MKVIPETQTRTAEISNLLSLAGSDVETSVEVGRKFA
jgi:hypothetical protein